ncbi:TLC domain-containing protein [Phakopsora pachyrhizi]|nr:TLC domain-containing protein [Phakopsora pachyrhizi]
MILIFLTSWSILEFAHLQSWITYNPISVFIKISYELPQTAEEEANADQRYGKGLKDLPFLAFYVIVFSFLRQAVIEYFVKPYATWLGLRGTKLQRFVDQGYAIFYWGSSTIIGLVVMSGQPTWWYKTHEFWRGYPHYRMKSSLKTYYLLQLSYWLQQMLVLSLRLEKPRSDFTELVMHHIVTLWLIGWSYITNLTMIGTAIFVSMDISDVFLGISKCINYTKYQRTSEFSFAIFLCVWTYFRHWQNLRILYSVYYEYDEYLPKFARRWAIEDEVYLTDWMKWQIFGPIMLLQFLNLFWYFLIWRIVFRMLRNGGVADVREEGETDEEDDQDQKPKKGISSSSSSSSNSSNKKE